MTVSEVAGRLSVSPDTIRRWEKKGLIRARRSELGHRFFSVKEVDRLKAKLGGEVGESRYTLLKSPVPDNALRTIELFAGAGGSALGFENAGFEHLLLSEIDKNAAQTLRINRPDWNVVEGDVSEIDFSSFREEVDVLIGGFPCQAFSYAGRKMGFEDTRGTLFYEFARAARESEPKVVVGENVRGLVNHDGGKTLSTMLSVLEDIGYRAEYKILKSQYLDVPQKRERLIIIGVRQDIDRTILFPKEKDHIVTLREAIGDRPISEGQKYPESKRKVLELVPPGGYWRDLPDEIQRSYMMASYFMGGGKTGMARRLSWDEPSLTLTCSPAQKQTERCHPEETRPLNIREYARIQTFPDDWDFSGSIASQYKQIGNAVPVNLGYHLGRSVSAMLGAANEYESFDTSSLKKPSRVRAELQDSLF